MRESPSGLKSCTCAAEPFEELLSAFFTTRGVKNMSHVLPSKVSNPSHPLVCSQHKTNLLRVGVTQVPLATYMPGGKVRRRTKPGQTIEVEFGKRKVLLQA